MTAYKRGDIVLVRFPYSDLVTWGKRPALVIQSDNVRTELGHLVLAQITSTMRSGPTRIPIAKDSESGRAMGLLMDSVIVLDVLQTTQASLIERAIGHCPGMVEIDAALRLLLEL